MLLFYRKASLVLNLLAAIGDKGQNLAQIQSELRIDKYAQWLNYADWRPLNIEGMHIYLTK
jgi:hypothetical protein